MVGPLLFAQNQDSTSGEHEPTSVGKGIDYLFNYLNMAGTMQASEFRPLTQRERTHLYLKTMVNPLGYIKAGFSAGLDQWKDKPPEWEQGASGYGRRFANIVGQYSIQRTVTFGLSQRITRRQPLFQFWQEGPLAAHWVRAGKWRAFAARQWKPASVDFPGRRRGRGAFLSRFWLPPSQHSAGDAAVSFGITMASNMGFGVLKEFLPDLGRALGKKRKQGSAPPQ